MATPAYSTPVTFVEHYTESYFRIRVQRPEGLNFVSGQFIMLGLMVDGKPLMRAYSIASAEWDEELEFYSIIIPDGALTSRLQHIEAGDEIILSAKAVGTLVTAGLSDGGKRLFMLSTGTGFAPFACLIRDEEVYEDYEEVYVTQTCRYIKDLKYAQERMKEAQNCPLVGEEATNQLRYYGSVTREPHQYQGRITDLMESGKLFTDLGIPPFNPETDRVMICGSIEMLHDIQAILDKIGFSRGTAKRPATYVWERAFTG